MKNSVVVSLIAFFMVACHKDEIAIPPHDSATALEIQVAMGNDYRYQLFYELENNQMVSSNDKTDWDLGFESSPSGWHIVLNSSRGMAVHRSEEAFADVTSELGLTWRWDVQSGHLDSTAVGNWQLEDDLYVLDLGYNHLGVHMGYKKFRITSMTTANYTIEFGDLSDLTSQTITIAKNEESLFTSFKFGVGEVLIAPANDTWDLLFTQYTHLFYDPLEAYVVTGVLLNRFNTSAAQINTKPFSEVTYEDAQTLTFSSNLNYIGYDWKTYDYVNGIYTVDPTVTYIVHTSKGYYYKLHFVDFYNNFGEKGYPKLEVQQL